MELNAGQVNRLYGNVQTIFGSEQCERLQVPRTGCSVSFETFGAPGTDGIRN